MSQNPDAPARPPVAAARRVVIKLGTRVLTHDDGRLALARLFSVVEAAVDLRRAGREPLLVSSGAVGFGVEALGLDQPPADLPDRQACAAVGQTRLMSLYQAGFSRLGVVCAQVLLTQQDFDDRERYLNLRSTLSTLLRRSVLPVINENDAVSVDELAFVEGARRPIFGDNDHLSALVAAKLDADLLVLLTDVAGVYDADPRDDPEAAVISRVDEGVDPAALGAARGSAVSRGGMPSKVAAAELARKAGCQVVVASGRDPEALPRVLAGADEGTWFPARAAPGGRRRWIAFAAGPRGALRLDPGAVRALVHRGASLLAPGVREVLGDFESGAVVELQGEGGEPIGRGIVSCDSAAARRWCAGEAPAGVRNHHALVHRDFIVLEADRSAVP